MFRQEDTLIYYRYDLSIFDFKKETLSDKGPYRTDHCLGNSPVVNGKIMVNDPVGHWWCKRIIHHKWVMGLTGHWPEYFGQWPMGHRAKGLCSEELSPLVRIYETFLITNNLLIITPVELTQRYKVQIYAMKTNCVACVLTKNVCVEST